MIKYILDESTNFTEIEELENYFEVFKFMTDNEYWEDILNLQYEYIRELMGLENVILQDLTIDEDEILDILLSYKTYKQEYIDHMSDGIDECLREHNNKNYRWKEINYINLKCELHCEDGPAIEYIRNSEEDRYFLNDTEYSEQEYFKINRQYKLNQILN